MGLASAIAALLLVVRNRVIKRIIILPGNTGVLIQSAGNRASRGKIVSPSVCEWGEGRGMCQLRYEAFELAGNIAC
jgi:hypothetical protein